MLKWINKKKNKKGFTLVELVVVIAILGILAAIAVPKLSKSRENAAIAAHNANVRTLESSATLAVSEGSTAITWDGESETKEDNNDKKTKGWGNYLQEWPKVPSGLVGKKFKGLNESGSEVDITINADTKYNVEIGSNGEIKVTPPKAITD
ncbi:MAG TPA: prepilin-type cleavage/methylation domain-containing protein [Tissierella sp.]|uniref:type II secretion system protein n=1 Tax=Tissierella praeacuta TaxID=43131 RepID=UPI000EDE2461|nr:type II secretion system protein [Tissierella praeacuta]HAE92706.1 prepilin-type cleavage/methylation domain-containing protein [Tissierella sp.]